MSEESLGSVLKVIRLMLGTNNGPPPPNNRTPSGPSVHVGVRLQEVSVFRWLKVLKHHRG